MMKLRIFRETALETSISKISLHGFSRLKFKDIRVRDKLENINLIDIEKAWFNPSVNFLGDYTFKLLLKPYPDYSIFVSYQGDIWNDFIFASDKNKYDMNFPGIWSGKMLNMPIRHTWRVLSFLHHSPFFKSNLFFTGKVSGEWSLIQGPPYYIGAKEGKANFVLQLLGLFSKT